MKWKLKEEEIKPKKNIVLKVKNKGSDTLMDEEDIGLLMRKFNKFLSKNIRKNFIKIKYKEDNDAKIICYKCKKPDHIWWECP